MRVSINRVDPSLPLPAYATAGATAFDLICRQDTTIAPDTIGRVPANVIFRVPDGFVLIVALRSSTPARKGLLMPHGVGIIDQDFCGPDDEIQIQVLNFAEAPVTVQRGERVAQGLLVPVMRCEWDEVPPGSESRGGFGSSG